MSVEENPDVFELENGDIRLWIEQEAIHLSAYDRRHYDPVELSATTALALAAKLEEMVRRIEA